MVRDAEHFAVEREHVVVVIVNRDAGVEGLELFDSARRSLRGAGIDVVPYTDVHVEPTDESFTRAAAFASEAAPDGRLVEGSKTVMAPLVPFRLP